MSGLLHGDLTALELFEDIFASGWGGLVSEEDVHEVEALDDCRVRDAEFLFDIADFALAAEKNEDELLEIERKAEERRDWEGCLDGGVTLKATKATDLEFAFAKRTPGNELFGWFAAHVGE